TAGVRLDTALAAARARLTVDLDDRVSDVAGVAGAAAVNLAVKHDTTADPGGDNDAKQRATVGAAGRMAAAPVLAQRHAGPVIREDDRSSREGLADRAHHVVLAPRRDVDRAHRATVHRTGTRNPRSDDGLHRAGGHHLVDEATQRHGDDVRVVGHRGRRGGAAVDAALRVHHRGGKLRAAYI